MLLAIVDADYKFIWADLGSPGGCSDSQILNASSIPKLIETNQIGFPPPEPLPGDVKDMPYFFIGDDIFALRTWMMKPYANRGMTTEERVFNYRLSRARRVVENAFGILVQRWQVMLNTCQHRSDTVRLIVKTCLVLHNLLKARHPHDNGGMGDGTAIHYAPGSWRRGLDLSDTKKVEAPNRATREAKMQRNLLRHYLNADIGEVPWQEGMI